MELGRKSRARQPMATKFSSDRGLSQEMRGKRVGEDLLSEDQRGMKKRNGGVRVCLLAPCQSGDLYTPLPLWLVFLRQTGLDMVVGGPGLLDKVTEGYGANMAGTLEAFMDMERCLLKWVDLGLQPSSASSRDPDPCSQGQS